MSDTGTRFADADPEDGWDGSDPVLAQLDNVVARLRDLLARARGAPDDPARDGRVLEDLATIRARILNRDLD